MAREAAMSGSRINHSDGSGVAAPSCASMAAWAARQKEDGAYSDEQAPQPQVRRERLRRADCWAAED